MLIITVHFEYYSQRKTAPDAALAAAASLLSEKRHNSISLAARALLEGADLNQVTIIFAALSVDKSKELQHQHGCSR